jgi:[ribosomal protein S5]-alanine N-acetyltransferase
MFSIFKNSFNSTPALFISGEIVYLRTPMADDYEAWAKLRHESKAFLTPWEPSWSADELSRAVYRQRILRVQQEIDADEAYSFFVIRKSDNQLLGGLNLNNIRRGAAEMASLGYWMGQAYAGQHYMSTAVRLAMKHAFGELKLRRIEAACLPNNHVSINLLESVGFRQEGLAREYLNIAGSWRDHILFALLAADQPRMNSNALKRCV